jgi:hypothetical protein
MSETTPETGHFGLTRIAAGEQFSKNGYAFSDLDRVTLDKILYAAISHSHDGSLRLADPTLAPGLSATPLGGTLPAGTTFYYRVSLADKYGLETAASIESSVTTPPPLPAPTSPSAQVETTGGAVVPGTWSYMITYVTSTGGETTPSGANNVQVTTGTTNRIRITLPSLPSGASGYRIYRSRPGQAQFYYLDQVTTTTYYDPANTEDQTITVPSVNTTNSTNSITITIPGGVIPVDCMGWKIYRSLDSGGYDGNSLVHYVVEGSSDVSTDVVTTFVDTGSAMLQGFPKDVSATISGGSVVNLTQIAGQIPLSAAPRGSRILNAFMPGVVADGQIATITNTPVPILPLRLTAYFQSPITDAGAVVKIRVLDSAATPNYVELVCAPAGVTPTTPVGYYDLKFPDYLSQVFESELGVRSSNANVPIVTDVAASNGQAVALAAQNEYVQQTLGVLTPGNYSLFATIKTPVYAAGANDLTISAIKASDSSVIASVSLTPGDSGTGGPHSSNYLEFAGPTFTASGTDEVLLQVAKSTTSTQSYYVDTYRYSAVVPVLAAGDITVQAVVTGTNTSGSNANFALWF